MSDFRLSRRAVTGDDDDVLADIYASTRRGELAPLPWSDELKGQFLRQQFEAQRRHYARHYPDAERLLLLDGNRPVGRLYLDRRPDEIRIVDIALLPSHRGRGIGRALLEEVLEEARANGVAVRIHVERENPARRLYDRLGFVPVGETGIYLLMEWNPAAGEARSGRRPER